MEIVNLRENQIVVKKNQKRTRLYVVLSGTVSFSIGNQIFYLESGSVIGLLEAGIENYLCDYLAEGDVKLAVYPFEKREDLLEIFREQPSYAFAFLHAALVEGRELLEHYAQLHQDASSFGTYVREIYEEYEKECIALEVSPKPFKKKNSLEELYFSKELPEWKVEYALELASVWDDEMQKFYGEKQNLCYGEILNISELMETAVFLIEEATTYVQKHGEILLNEEKDDLLSILMDWSVKLALKGKDTTLMMMRVRELQAMVDDFAILDREYAAGRFREYWGTDFEHYAIIHEGDTVAVMSCEEYLKTDCVKTVLEYADYDLEAAKDLKHILSLCREVKDIHDTEDSITALRKGLTKHFYQLYPMVFLHAVEDASVPVPVEIFLRFGVLDLNLLQEEQIRDIYELNGYFQRKEAGKFYSMYEWLKTIFYGQKEPCRNDFDQDYKQYLVELMKQQRITREQAKQLQGDMVERVRFEVSNMFMTANRATYGRVTTFCPILFGKDIIRSPKDMLVSFEKLEEALLEIRRIDYSVFYREVFFQDPEHGIPQTLIYKEVLPDMILMPNTGSKGMMWQEISGVKKDTPARFMFPMFSVDDVMAMMVDVVARYRWEICRRIQGVHWNDIRDKSLTSEYSDYIQYYRKNSEISPQNKEKIKQQLVTAKNNYREVFVLDYRSWMKYEINGNLRLNSVARKILLSYCPFGAEIRKGLKDNPQFRELFGRFEIMNQKKYQKILPLWNKYRENGGQMTPELQANLDYYNL